MFTAKDLEVYKDSLKEKKSTPAKTGEKLVKTAPSVARISKPPLKLQNEEPNRERMPLSVVYKASNTLKDPHKLPSPTPVGTSKHADPAKKPKDIASKIPSPAAKLHTAEADPLVKALEFRSEPLRSPRETLLSKSPSIKAGENKVAGVRKLKEPSMHGVNGIYQKLPSLSSGAKAGAPAVDINASLCSECTRAASEGAVCFIGNDGRVSACTTRSAVRLCKNLNCAANNPDYVAAMANAPKKYLISKRHLLKAQYAPKSRSSRPKSPNLQQMEAGGDALSPSNGEMSFIKVDMSLTNHAVELDDGGLSPVANGDLRLFDDGFNSEGKMGDDVTGVKEEHGIAGIDCDRLQNGAAIDEKQKDFSFLERATGETESPKFLISGCPEEQIEAYSEGSRYVDDNFDTFGCQELDSEDTDGSLMQRTSMTDESGKKVPLLISDATGEQVMDDDDHQIVNAGRPIDISQVGDDENIGFKVGSDDTGQGLVVNDQVHDIRPIVDINQVEDDNQFDNTVPPTDIDHVADEEQSGGVTRMSDAKQVEDDDQIDDIVSTISVSGKVDGDMSGGFMANDTNQVADDEKGGDSTLPADMHVAHDEQSNVNDSEDHEQSGEICSLTHGHVAVDDHSDDETPVNGTYEVDDALSGDITSPNNVITFESDDHVDETSSLKGTHVADAEPNDDISLSNGTHVADAEQPNDDITPLNDRHVMDDDHDDGTSRHLEHDADDNQNDCGTSPHVLDDDDESSGDDNEDDEPDAIVGDTCTAEDHSPMGLLNGVERTSEGKGSGGEDGGGVKKGSKQRRRRVLGIVEESNPETVTLRKQQMQERKQAEEWMLNYAIEGVVHKLAPTGEAKVKILVEAFESIMSHTDVDAIDSQNASKQK